MSADYICEGVDLAGVEVIEQDRRFVKQARKEVQTQAQKMLEQGMETQVCTQQQTSLVNCPCVSFNVLCLYVFMLSMCMGDFYDL